MHITTEQHCETLSAWIDGEPCDPAAVDAALETPDGRAFVIEVMALRRVVQVTGETTSRPVSQPVVRRASWIALAAAAVVCLAAGYGVARVTEPEAQVPIAGIPVSLDAGDAPSAPAPTHVIRFESGVDWRETAGGN